MNQNERSWGRHVQLQRRVGDDWVQNFHEIREMGHCACSDHTGKGARDESTGSELYSEISGHWGLLHNVGIGDADVVVGGRHSG